MDLESQVIAPLIANPYHPDERLQPVVEECGEVGHYPASSTQASCQTGVVLDCKNLQVRNENIDLSTCSNLPAYVPNSV